MGALSESAKSSLQKLDLSEVGGGLEKEHRALKETMAGLRGQLQEVVQVNQNWQEYHDKREQEFQQLRGQLQQTEQRLAQAGPSAQLSEQQQEKIDELVLQYKRQLEVAETDKEKVLDENRQLCVQLAQQVDTNEQLQGQIQSLLLQMRSRPNNAARIEEKERIHALEMQVKVFSEDFGQERRDREKAQARLTELEREVSAYKIQLESLQRAAMSRINQRRFASGSHALHNAGVLQCDDDEDLDDMPMPEPSSPPIHLIGRNIFQSNNLEDGEDEVDMPTFAVSRKAPPMDAAKPRKQRLPDILACPPCQKDFPTNRHSDLLQHM